MKRCPRCEETKPADAYWKRSKSWDGLQPYCKACQNATAPERQSKARASETQEQKAARMQAHLEWQRANGQRVAAYVEKWRQKNMSRWKESQVVRAKREAAQISDAYVRRMLSSRSTLRPSQIPDALVQLKRQFIALNREIKFQEQR